MLFPMMKLHAPEVLSRGPQLIARPTDRSPFDALASRWRIAAFSQDANCQTVPLTARDKYHRREKRRVRPRSRRACHWRTRERIESKISHFHSRRSWHVEAARIHRPFHNDRYAMDLSSSPSSFTFSRDRRILLRRVRFGARENDRGQGGADGKGGRRWIPMTIAAGSRRRRPHENHASLVSYFAVMKYFWS